jgi:hypothetical protein
MFSRTLLLPFPLFLIAHTLSTVLAWIFGQRATLTLLALSGIRDLRRPIAKCAGPAQQTFACEIALGLGLLKMAKFT